MTYSSYPFDNQDTTEGQYSRLFRELQDSGVVETNGGPGLLVYGDATGMVVRLAVGRAIVRGHVFDNDAVSTLNISASTTQARIDRIVLRLDPTANSIVPAILQGTPSATPAVPALTQTDTGIYELPLAQVTVGASVPNIASAAVLDERRYVGSRVGVWTIATRPTSPRAGAIGYNATLGCWEAYTGITWRQINVPSVPDAATRTGLSTTNAASLYAGFRVRQTDDAATYEWDGTVWVPFDSKWQTYTPAVTVSNVAVVQNNATILGRYFRRGREVTVEGYWLIGSTTSYAGQNGILRFDYPTGLRPAGLSGVTLGTYTGTVRIVGNTGTAVFPVANEYNAAPASRRMVFVSTGDLVVQGGASGGLNMSAAGHSAIWHNTYTTDFEA